MKRGYQFMAAFQVHSRLPENEESEHSAPEEVAGRLAVLKETEGNESGLNGEKNGRGEGI